MASLRLNPLPPPHHRLTTVSKPKTHQTIKCGPRDNRGPLQKGRTLSIEAIQAVQLIKRSHRLNPDQTDNVLNKTLSRLIKNDLVATFNELVRQDQLILALKVFSALKTESSYKTASTVSSVTASSTSTGSSVTADSTGKTASACSTIGSFVTDNSTTDLNLIAKLVTAMARNNMKEGINELINGVSVGDLVGADRRGVVTVVKALLAADNAEGTVRVYEMMREGGCEVDDYLGSVLSRGLRRLGKREVADEIDREIGRIVGGATEKVAV